MTIDSEYEKALQDEPNGANDMRAHAAALRELANARRVTEFGTRHGISARYLLAGRPVSLTCYDVARSDKVDDLYIICAKENIEFTFHQQDIELLREIAPCDLVFINAMHNGNSVAIYLRLAREAGASVIALHDTELFGENGDVPGTPGINRAIEQLCQQHPEWQVAYYNPASFGFTVLVKLPLNPEYIKAGILIAQGDQTYHEIHTP